MAVELLRRFEPVLAFTEGEMFYPMAVDDYLRSCTLNEHMETGGTAVLAQEGELTSTSLADLSAARSDRRLTLNPGVEPVSGKALQQWQAHRPSMKERRQEAHGGLFDRAGDLLARIPGAIALRSPASRVAGMQSQYADVLAREPRFVYYGRVITERAYTVLSYHYFYAMSDWRSSFGGAGDHLGDWHSVAVYLANAGDGYLEPAWTVCENAGGVEVRAWDTLALMETHPQLYVAAGSHTVYFVPGDAMAACEVEPLRPVWGRARALWPFRRTRRRGELYAGPGTHSARGPAVPFVCYARGDGVRIGTGQPCEWSGVGLDEAGQKWVEDYRGAWGPDESSMFAAGRSSTGPKYNRSGGVRRSWADPVGWAKLDRHAVPAMVDLELSRRLAVLEHDAELVASEADRLRSVLPQLEVEIEALEASRSNEALLNRRRIELAHVEEDIAVYDLRRTDDLTSASACREMLARRRAGGEAVAPGIAVATSTTAQDLEASTNALSLTGVVVCLIVAASVISLRGDPWLAALALLAGGVFLVDSLLRGTFSAFVGNLAIGLAAATAVVLMYELFWPVAIVLLVLGGVVLIAGDLRDLRLRL